ncbi:ferredoxin [Streptomyces sp. NRRL S-350]|uniref:ferredoxin n=1 Tax=Streptomyces sp. NRRL S-350 TaxID=1463902 RepID=UPI0004BF7B99|nr:ferredoxin [Streptomyces sp. NRRL S-350]
MRVSADQDACIGGGLCALHAPTVFDQDDRTGVVVVLDADPAEERRAEVEAAVRNCPSGAVRLQGQGR